MTNVADNSLSSSEGVGIWHREGGDTIRSGGSVCHGFLTAISCRWREGGNNAVDVVASSRRTHEMLASVVHDLIALPRYSKILLCISWLSIMRLNGGYIL